MKQYVAQNQITDNVKAGVEIVKETSSMNYLYPGILIGGVGLFLLLLFSLSWIGKRLGLGKIAENVGEYTATMRQYTKDTNATLDSINEAGRRSKQKIEAIQDVVEDVKAISVEIAEYQSQLSDRIVAGQELMAAKLSGIEAQIKSIDLEIDKLQSTSEDLSGELKSRFKELEQSNNARN